MTARIILHSHCPIKVDDGLHQINMEFARQGLALAHVEGFYEDADFYGIQMWIDAFMTMENAPMPSATLFKSPVTMEMVGFVMLCFHLERLFVRQEMEREDEEMDNDIYSVNTFELSDDDSVFSVGEFIFDEDAPGSPRSVMEWDV